MIDKRVNPYKTVLDAGNAYWMARLSDEIYTEIEGERNTPDEQAILKSLKSDDVRFSSVSAVEAGNTEAALIAHKDYLCMVFRGTDELKDWIDNIKISPTEKLFGEFHEGFWNTTEAIWDDLDQKYQEEFEKKKRPLFMTGHSLEGAMATIAAAKLADIDKPFTSVYTFGQPRAMTRETARTLNGECKARLFRFQNNNDIVPRVPPRKMGYGHAGNVLYISEEKKIHKDPGRWFKFLDRIDGYMEALGKDGFDMIKDHDMDDYLQATEKWDLD